MRVARYFLGAGCVLLLIAWGASIASARRITANESRFGVIWTPSFSNAVETVSCERITLTGSFHSRTIVKTVGALIGYIIAASIREPTRCVGGSARTLTEGLPWHFLYQGFTGTLPNITAISFRIIGLNIGVTSAGTTCLYRSTLANPAGIIANREAGGAVSSVRSDETLQIPPSGGFPCEFNGSERISGTGAGVENPIVFRLI